MEKKLAEVINRLDALKREVAELEAVVAELSAAAVVEAEEEPLDIEVVPADIGTVPAAGDEVAVDLSEPIDLSLDEADLSVGVSVEPEPTPVGEDLPEPEPEPVPEPEDLPVEEDLPVQGPVAEPEPEARPAAQDKAQAAEKEEEGFFGLFGEEIPAAPRDGRRSRRGNRESIGEAAESGSAKAVIDTMSVGAAWRTDIPGPEVKSLRSAIALGDQVMFISRLFRKDSALYQDTVDRLNRTGSLTDAIKYLSETFPEWDLASDDVYKFMMAVRRKIRK